MIPETIVLGSISVVAWKFITNLVSDFYPKKKIVIKLVNDPKIKSTVLPHREYSLEEWFKLTNASILYGKSLNHIDCDV